MSETLFDNELWPPREYYVAIQRLKAAVGQPLYIVEMNAGNINAGVKFSDKP